MYFDQLLARYQAFPNILWNYAKETFYNPDKTNVKKLLKEIRNKDAYNRLLSFQDDKKLWSDPECRGLFDYYTLQQHQDFHTYTADKVLQKEYPVFNSEFGYETGFSIQDRTYTESQTIEDYVNRAWDVVLAGGSSCYYYTFTGWDVIRPEDTPPGYQMFASIFDFFSKIDWWNFVPDPNFLLCTPSACLRKINAEEYVIKTTHHGWVLLGYGIKDYEFEGVWLDIFTGESRELKAADCVPHEIDSAITIFTSPFSGHKDDFSFSVLKLTIKKKENQ
jgi:hypothetical protein